MTRIFLLFLLTAFSNICYSQNTFKAIVKDAVSKEPLAGAIVRIKVIDLGANSDQNGNVEISNVPDGSFQIEFSYVGYNTEAETFTFPISANFIAEILLSPSGDEETEEIIVNSTRTSRTIEDVPTRVEVIEYEEIDEKSNMRPSSVSMLLHESTGIQVQQTSAASFNASIRIQGLDGRYTQLLRDSYPNYGNFSGGLSILEIPPLDLKQVEIIKGPASTLYGGGAIAGVVNFISRLPEEKSVFNLLLNQTSLGATDVSAYSSGKYKKFGYTFYSSYNYQNQFDVDKDDFTELPNTNSYNLNPRLFFYPNQNSTLSIGNSLNVAERKGGDVQVINDNGSPQHSYFENNKTVRNISTAEYENNLNKKFKLNIKQSFSFFRREIEIPEYSFDGIQYFAYTDASVLSRIQKHILIGGGNIIIDNFDERSVANRDQKIFTGGIYVQDSWDVSEKLFLENGIRADFVRDYDAFILPRISVLYKFRDNVSSRLSAGLGYKIPSMFTESAEEIQYRSIQQIEGLKAERSYGGTADINFRTLLSKDLFFSLNQMFFFTQLNDPLVLTEKDSVNFVFVNASDPVQSYGFETNSKFVFKEYVKLFLGYTYNNSRAKYLTGDQHIRLLPKNKVNIALIYENLEIVKLGFEAYYTDVQVLSNGTKTPPYWELGFMAEKAFGNFSVYLNAENFTDTKQSNYKTVVNGPHTDPTFDEIWTHVEGISFNGGVKIRF